MDMYQKREQRKKNKTEENNTENTNKVNINWYPGHMVTAKKEIESVIKLIDIVIEVLDARLPNSSRNPFVEKIAVGKERIVVLNKFDLADEENLKKWIEYFKNQNITVICTNASTGENIPKLLESIKKIGKKIYESKVNNSKIHIQPIYRAVIIGIPNVGKSTVINKLSNKNSANVGNKPGVTRKKQWIRLSDNIELMDTPGLLWPNLDDKDAGIKLALTGNIKQDILDVEELAVEGLKIILSKDKYKNMLCSKYGIENIDSIKNEIDNAELEYNKYALEMKIIEKIGQKRGALIKGGEIDTYKVSNLLLDDLKNGKIGNISFE